MKIFHLIHKIQNRGAETFASQLANHQERAGHEVEIMAIYNGNVSLPWTKPIPSLQPSKRFGFMDVKAALRLSRFINDFRPDIIQANSGDTLKFLVFSKKLFGWKVPVIFRNASEVGRYLNSFFQKKFNAYLYKETDYVISVSKASEKDFLIHFPFFKGRTEVIPIGMEDKGRIIPVDLLPERKKHVIHIGGFTFEKNHDGLLNIFERVRKKDDQVHLHLVGDGPLRPGIEMKVKEAGLEDCVTFYGFVSNPLNYIKAADVLVLPSLIEGLPGVLLEAMYCKVPIVANNVGGVSEIVNSGNGHLIEKGNEGEFADAILKALFYSDKEILGKSYKMIKDHFMNNVITEKFLESYIKIIEFDRSSS